MPRKINSPKNPLRLSGEGFSRPDREEVQYLNHTVQILNHQNWGDRDRELKIRQKNFLGRKILLVSFLDYMVQNLNQSFSRAKPGENL